jgi:hypothetical protein
MPEHQQEYSPVAILVPGAFGSSKELFNFAGGKVFAVGHHFVQCLGGGKSLQRNTRNGVGCI